MKFSSTILLAAVVLASGCRGTRSDEPPVHLNLNMDYQERYDPQEANPFFADNRSMRPPVPGTIARGTLREDTEFYEGRTEGGAYIEQVPVPTTRELLVRGQERYNIFCAPCHGRAGDGEGIITTAYAFTPAPTFHSERLRDVADGYVYDVIARGVRTMPSYAHQVPVADRWAITAYVRALQRSQYASPEDVPPSIRADIEQQAGGGAQAQDAAAATEAQGADTAAADTAAQPDGGNQ